VSNPTDDREERSQPRRIAGHHFLNIGYSDIIIHHVSALTKTSNIDGYELFPEFYHLLSDLPKSLSWIPLDGSIFDEPLILHCKQSINIASCATLIITDEHKVAGMLTSTHDARFQNLLLSMSFTDNSSSSVAVRQALYALTALHLYGFEVAMRYKYKAVRALDHAHSLQWTSNTKDRLQHIAAGLLLSLFEVCSNNAPQNDQLC
jgi:hypothetical protein